MGDADSVQYCANWWYSTTAIPFTGFSTTCYAAGNPGTPLSAADVPKIDKIFVMVPSRDGSVTVTDLCITKIEFTK
jgi:hypothetical protein